MHSLNLNYIDCQCIGNVAFVALAIQQLMSVSLNTTIK